jgi:hypothetical protein
MREVIELIELTKDTLNGLIRKLDELKKDIEEKRVDRYNNDILAVLLAKDKFYDVFERLKEQLASLQIIGRRW